MRRAIAGCVLAGLSLLLLGCGGGLGVQSDQARNCDNISGLAELDAEVKKVDLRVLNNRPDEVTLEAIRRIAEDYARDIEEYRQLLAQAEAGLAEVESDANADRDLTAAWQLFVERLNININGMVFFQEAFANPNEVIGEDAAAFQREGQDWLEKGERINGRLEERLIVVFEKNEFEKVGEGYVIDC